jgi:hypothetical protein
MSWTVTKVEGDNEPYEYCLFDGSYLIAMDHSIEKLETIAERHNVEISKCSNALRRLITAVNTHMLCGIPEIKTVDDLIRGMRSVADKLQAVACDPSLQTVSEGDKIVSNPAPSSA